MGTSISRNIASRVRAAKMGLAILRFATQVFEEY
jgi:hypothetical protein